jgi:hypothetical protein
LGNGVTEKWTNNDRFQATGLQVAQQNGGSLLGLGLYPCASQQTSCSTTTTGGNNGNLLSQTITIPGLSATQSYSYDSLNRLSSAQEAGGGAAWTENYQYYGNGNRWMSPRTGLPPLTLLLPRGLWHRRRAVRRRCGR